MQSGNHVCVRLRLNDSDERVRYEAADEIGDQLRKNPCCLNDAVVCALTQALGDCDKKVARAAARALCIAGYDVKDCEVPCGTCTPNSCGPTAAAPWLAVRRVVARLTSPRLRPGGCSGPGSRSRPAAAPASATEVKEPEAYFPGRLKEQQTQKKSALQNLFGLR